MFIFIFFSHSIWAELLLLFSFSHILGWIESEFVLHNGLDSEWVIRYPTKIYCMWLVRHLSFCHFLLLVGKWLSYAKAASTTTPPPTPTFFVLKSRHLKEGSGGESVWLMLGMHYFLLYSFMPGWYPTILQITMYNF